MDLVQQAEAGGAAAAEVQRPPQNAEPFRLKGGGFTILIIEPLDIRAQDFFRRLMDRLGQAPNFYRNAPVAVDLQALTDPRPINFAELANRLRQHRLIPVGVMNATAEQAQAAANAGLALLPAPRPAAMPEPPAPRATSAETKPAASTNAAASAAARTPPPPSSGAKAMVVAEPVRAGAQVYAEGRDLVLISPVSSGAEVLADGNIHAYGRLRGRALAGVAGDETARIFCRSLEAELVSIAGRFRVSEDMDQRLIGRPAQIFLDGGFLMIEPLGT